ncbi:hypothetical protein AC028_08010 [Xanthomonas citri pv. aurantifolii]|nr:hypothetical protein AC028_08010 [Xanthomonas citri pv. aurantifolii]ARE58669.1 hypothetical protein TP45_00915 [Xanthomonas citri pv. aurantifolii]
MCTACVQPFVCVIHAIPGSGRVRLTVFVNRS